MFLIINILLLILVFVLMALHCFIWSTLFGFWVQCSMFGLLTINCVLCKRKPTAWWNKRKSIKLFPLYFFLSTVVDFENEILLLVEHMLVLVLFQTHVSELDLLQLDDHVDEAKLNNHTNFIFFKKNNNNNSIFFF